MNDRRGSFNIITRNISSPVNLAIVMRAVIIRITVQEIQLGMGE